MATQLELAMKGNITDIMKKIANDEGLSDEYVREMIAKGKVVVPNNINRRSNIVGIGKGLRTKINASIGTSSDIIDIDAEIRKAR
ncbi:MAG: phosphomethylpyrimidine synthase ThiC, partial [Nitrospinae bacterium]|nr:phosphomethylpyrimidine synthase ThiC [Nitrospinota bacterium]